MWDFFKGAVMPGVIFSFAVIFISSGVSFVINKVMQKMSNITVEITAAYLSIFLFWNNESISFVFRSGFSGNWI